MSVQFVFDFLSPYAYLGWRRVRRELPEVVLDPVPVLFAALLDANGTKGPAEIPSKRLYTWKHVVRLAHEQGVPISPPPAHPFNPLLGLRIAASPLSLADRVSAIDALFDATWGGGPGISDPVQVIEVLNAVGLRGRALVDGAVDPAVKQQVKDSTAAALAAGVFGVPSFIVDDEVFWGQDSIPHIAAYLKGNDAADAQRLERWMALPSGVTRRAARG